MVLKLGISLMEICKKSPDDFYSRLLKMYSMHEYTSNTSEYNTRPLQSILIIHTF